MSATQHLAGKAMILWQRSLWFQAEYVVETKVLVAPFIPGFSVAVLLRLSRKAASTCTIHAPPVENHGMACCIRRL